ncbi:MATE family efflux transporter [Micromonospora sp. WMMD1128]|uniref:MATE family efflux transporter n=1 Tax=unclassified Micromonospora TaxID=2617518 RepID=UPI00248CF611|nr:MULTISPECIES: MATE family efflux transporter [unclassified Micromonospora]WBB75644.1 MATE family efflux transporter [Micromonospora sp. WMMD1128]WFE30887.1 MATE family efflux transporter [Micromonospora sp. WMMD975]
MTDMTKGPPLRQIVGFALPLTAASLFQQVYLLVDGIVVGRYVGVEGLAAVGASGPLFYLLNAMFIGLGTAFTIRLAHLRGAGQDRQRRDVVVSLALVTVGWTVGCVLLVTVLAQPVLALMGITGELAEQCARFIQVLSLGFPGIFGSAAVSAYLRGLGNSRAAMWVQAAGNLLNIGLALLFVGGLGFGIAGAALATAAASSAAAVIGVVASARIYPLPPGRPAREAVRGELVDATRLGLPLATQHIILAVGIMVLVWIIEPYGEVVMAAFTVVARVEAFSAILFLSFSGAVTTFAAQNLGAGHHERARHALLRTLGLTFALTLVFSAVVLLARAPIAALFTDDPTTRRVTGEYLTIIFPFLPLYTLMVVLHGYLNGARRTTAPLICTIVAFVMVQIPFAYLLSRPFGIHAIMWAVVASWTVGLSYSTFCLRQVLRSPANPAPGTLSTVVEVPSSP